MTSRWLGGWPYCPLLSLGLWAQRAGQWETELSYLWGWSPGCSQEDNNCGKQAAAAAAELLQSRPTLCDPRDGSPPGSTVAGILQARALEWVAISFSNAWKWKVKAKLLSRVRLTATPGTAAYQAHLSMGFSRQEYWSGLPLLSPEKQASSK